MVWRDDSDAGRDLKRSRPRVRTDFRDSIFTFRRTRDGGGGGGWRRVRKEEGESERDDATRINRVTVWMQHTSLPRTNKAGKRENVVTYGGRHGGGSPVQCLVRVSVSEHESLK